jgi:hypothetical protein
MAQLHELNSIRERKRLLMAQSETCRRSLALQLDAFRADSAWLHRGVDSVVRYRSFLWLAAPVAGFLIVRRGKVLRQFLIQGLTAWQVVSRIWRWTRPLRRSS